MDKYTVIKEIGKGNYGKVVLVEDAERNKFVVKLIDTTGLSKSEIEKAHYEVKVQSNLRHPHVTRFFESFEFEKFTYKKQNMHRHGVR